MHSLCLLFPLALALSSSLCPSRSLALSYFTLHAKSLCYSCRNDSRHILHSIHLQSTILRTLHIYIARKQRQIHPKPSANKLWEYSADYKFLLKTQTVQAKERPLVAQRQHIVRVSTRDSAQIPNEQIFFFKNSFYAETLLLFAIIKCVCCVL